MGSTYRVWGFNHYDQPFQAGEGPQGDCGSEADEAGRISEMSALP